MWGNDPELTQEAYDKGAKPTQSWIYPEAEAIRLSLGGKRKWWGWLGRLDGPGTYLLHLFGEDLEDEKHY